MNSLTLPACSVLLSAVAATGCTDTGGGSAGQAGSGGGSTGQAGNAGTTGQAGNGGSAGGGSSGFLAVAPCNAEASYVTNTTTVSFSGATAAYTPNCLKVSAGTSVTFTGDFSTHPMEPSALRGTLTGNPITTTGGLPDGGTSKSFTFPNPGFFAYYCDVHGPSDSGAGMVGVVWVQ